MFSLGQLNRSAGSVLSPVLNEELTLGALRLSIVIGVMFLAQGLMQLPAGVLLDRFGPRLTIPALSAIAALGSFVFGMSQGWLGLAIGRALIGIGFAAVMSGTYVLFTRWVPADRFSVVSGRFLFIGGIGGLLATTPLAASIEMIGWRITFILLGIATLAVCVLTYAMVRDAPDADAKAVAPATVSLLDTIRGVGEVLRNKAIWPMLIVGICIYSPSQVLLGIWAGPFLQDIHGLNAIDRGYVLLAMAMAMNTGALIFGPLERRFNARKAIILASMLLIALLFSLLAAIAFASLWQTIALFIVIPLVSPFFIVVMSHAQALFPRGAAGRAMTSVNMFAVAGIFIMQNVTGAVVSAVPHETGTGSLTGYRLVFALMAATFVLATLIYSLTPEIRHSDRGST